MTRSFSMAALSLLFLSHAAFAGQDGRGGDVVWCYKENPYEIRGRGACFPTNYKGSLYVQLPREYYDCPLIPTVMTREYFQIARLKKKSKFIESLEHLPENKILELLLDRFRGIKKFYRALRDLNQNLEPIEDGIPFIEGLLDPGDNGFLLPVPNWCTVVQAVVRYGPLFRYDPLAFRYMDNLQKAMIRLHELVYSLGTACGHETSMNTENLIILAIGRDLSKQELERYLRELHFEKYL